MEAAELIDIVSRNGIMMILHYVHLTEHGGEEFGEAMIIRGSLERLAPVMMTATPSFIGLLPLFLGAGQTGKEILYPVATVILGGLISSTMLDFFVHPALFWLMGLRAAERVVNSSDSEQRLLDGSSSPSSVDADAADVATAR